MNTIRHTPIAILVLCLLFVLAAPASYTRARQDEPITHYMPAPDGPPFPLEVLDPQVSSGPLFINSLFLGLTAQNPITSAVEPSLATGWNVSADGLVWTFTLRDDVPWVRWDPLTAQFDTLRIVTAHDVVYGIQRICDPRTHDPSYASIVRRLIAGCSTLVNRPSTEVSDADLENVAVRALDDQTVEIRLEYRAGHFLSMASLLFLRPVPREVIDEFGAEWTAPGVIVTNGPFVLESWQPERGVYTLRRNPLLPGDLHGPGNVERVVVVQYDTVDAVFQAYVNDQLDFGSMPEGVAPDNALTAQMVESYYPHIMYFGISNDIPPMDNIHVRRAFAAAFNRDRFAAHNSGWLMMTHFTPPGVFGAPPIDEIGVGYDPDYAREQLALGGYPGCEGLPEIWAVTWEGAGSWFADFLWVDIAEVLGCDPALLVVEELPDWFSTILPDPDNPSGSRPHLWTLGWYADYLDANNFLGDLLACDGEYFGQRPCSAVDDLIVQAAVDMDPLSRVATYRDIEERLFGPQGEVPLIPIGIQYSAIVVKPWFSGPLLNSAVYPFNWFTIDQAAQLAARGE